jgi:phosphoenolpyruvate carboxykinase (GTP)
VERTHQVTDVENVLDQAGLTNVDVREYVKEWAAITGASRIEVVSAADDARLIAAAL